MRYKYIVVAVVVYESIWGTTARLARAIAQGLGAETRVLSTFEASPGATMDADFLVLGAPMHSFGLPSLATIEAVRTPGPGAASPEIKGPLMHDWLKGLPRVAIPAAAFETRIGDLVGEGGALEIVKTLERQGYRLIAPVECFQVERLPVSPGPGGWVRPEELERAQKWGADLAGLVDPG
ncbi:MAG: hypothetical protein MUP36_01965 [Demequinaceae bacterium]|nr:hypothetical protein [Demequinaceae bacterium]